MLFAATTPPASPSADPSATPTPTPTPGPTGIPSLNVDQTVEVVSKTTNDLAAIGLQAGIGAAIDDGLLDIPFRVLSFESVFFDRMGNARPENSDGANFTENQRNLMRSLRRGQRFYVSRVVVVGPDGLRRTLPQPVEIIVN